MFCRKKSQCKSLNVYCVISPFNAEKIDPSVLGDVWAFVTLAPQPNNDDDDDDVDEGGHP